MSRIGKRPITVPNKVTVTINGSHVAVKGPKGELSRVLPSTVTVEQEGDTILVKRHDESRLSRQLHGLSRTLVANMVDGVSQGFQKRLEIQGVGYRAQVQGRNLVLSLGYSHPVQIEPPEGIQLAVENNTNVIVSGFDKELVGNVAAQIRDKRPPEPYKGKGVRYAGEAVRRKAGKAGKK
ncbi:50S ribosomal protein L6 [Chroococcidiopsis sp.]|uniref:50S ribosomal protein L6 n=1 Tax=Chroococcidiopsis sp. TaxID=3088168 RepID=UPI003F33CF06